MTAWVIRLRWRNHDLGYALALGAAACALVFAAASSAPLLPARWTCHGSPGCFADNWTLFQHLFVWDAGWYEGAAVQGYRWDPVDPGPQDIAFLPMWPLLLRALHWLAGAGTAYQAAVFLVALIIALASVCAFHVFARYLLDGRTARLATLFYTTFPAMHFMLQSYPVGLLNLLSAVCLTALLGRRHAVAALWAGLATAAGPIAVSLSAAVSAAAFADAWPALRQAGTTGRQRLAVLRRLAGIAALSLWGLLAFMAWQWAQFGDPIAFVHAQQGWGAAPPFHARLPVWLGWQWPYTAFRTAWTHVAALPSAKTFRLAQPDLQVGLNAAGFGVALLSLFGLLRRKTWPLLLQAWLVLALFIWFVATLRVPDCAFRLIYLAPGLFIGLAWLTRRAPVLGYALAAASSVVLIVQATLSGLGFWVV